MVEGIVRLAAETDQKALYGLETESFRHGKTPGNFMHPNALYFVYDAGEKGVIASLGIRLKRGGLCELLMARTKKEWRRQGIMLHLMHAVCTLFDNDMIGRCWRTSGRETPNINAALEAEGFELYLKGAESYRSACDVCSEKEQGSACCEYHAKGCCCHMDLYRRDAREHALSVYLYPRNVLSIYKGGKFLTYAGMEQAGDKIRLRGLSNQKLDSGSLAMQMNRKVEGLSFTGKGQPV